MTVVPRTTVICLITKSGERLFHADNGSQFGGFYKSLETKPEEFPITISVFDNLQDYLNWKKGNIVKCKVTMLYHYSDTEGLDILAEAYNLSYIGARSFAMAS